jgi:glycosyltransferase involved in cell wall biosynthesis
MEGAVFNMRMRDPVTQPDTPDHPELISVVVATYNQAEYLPITLDSIWFQNYPNIEIIVVNDGSTDNTSEVLSDYLQAVDREEVSFASNYKEESGQVERTWHARYQRQGRTFVLLEHESNQGLSAALNTGFVRANGRLCTFIASDDMLLPTMLSELKHAMEETAADFAYADMHIVDDHGRILRRFSLPDYSFEEAFCYWYLCGICKLYRRDLHETVGYYNEKIKPQDHEMFLRFAMHGARFVHVPKVLANVRIHDEEERRIHNHSEANWNQVFKESSELVLKARRFAGNTSNDGPYDKRCPSPIPSCAGADFEDSYPQQPL